MAVCEITRCLRKDLGAQQRLQELKLPKSTKHENKSAEVSFLNSCKIRMLWEARYSIATEIVENRDSGIEATRATRNRLVNGSE